MFVGLHIAMVMETVTDLKLTVKEPDQKEKQEESQDSLWDQKVKRARGRVRAWVRTTITWCGDVPPERENSGTTTVIRKVRREGRLEDTDISSALSIIIMWCVFHLNDMPSGWNINEVYSKIFGVRLKQQPSQWYSNGLTQLHWLLTTWIPSYICTPGYPSLSSWHDVCCISLRLLSNDILHNL